MRHQCSQVQVSFGGASQQKSFECSSSLDPLLGAVLDSTGSGHRPTFSSQWEEKAKSEAKWCKSSAFLSFLLIYDASF